jgi:hypothetical protein
MITASPAPVRLLLASWPTRARGYRGMQLDLPPLWLVGKVHAVSSETAAYLLRTHPDHFVEEGT